MVANMQIYLSYKPFQFAAYLLFALSLLAANISYAALPALDMVEEPAGNEATADSAGKDNRQQIKENQQDLKELQQKIDELQVILEQAPQQKIELHKKMQQAAEAQPQAIPESALPSEIEHDLATERARNKAWAEQLKQLSEEQQRLLAAQETLPVAIAEQEKILTQQRKASNEALVGSVSVIDKQLVETGLSVQESKLKWLNLQQDTLVQRRELAKVRAQTLEYQLALSSKQIELLQARLLEVSMQSSLKVIEQAKRFSLALANAPAPIPQWNAENEALAVESEALNREFLLIQQTRQELEAQRQRTIQNIAQIKDNIKWLKNSPAFSEAINAQLQQLPDLSDKSNLAKAITHAHLKRFQLSAELSKLKDIPSLIKKTVADFELNSLHEKVLASILSFRYELLTSSLEKIEQLIAESTRLDALQDQFSAEIADERDFLREKLLFISDRARLWDLNYLDINTWFGTSNLLKRVQNLLRDSAAHGIELLLLGVFLLFISGVLLQLKRAENGYRLAYAKSVGKVRKDTFTNTLILLLLAIRHGALISLCLFAVNRWIELRLSTFYSHDLSNIFVSACVVVFVWESLVRMAMPDGLLQLHFGYSKAIINWLKSTLSKQRWLLYSLLLSIIISEFLAAESESLLRRIVFIVLMLWSITFTHSLLKRHRLPALLPAFAQSKIALRLLRVLLILPLIAVTALAVWGYFYASRVALFYYCSLLLIFGSALLLQQLGVRWLKIEQRKLTLQRTLDKRGEQVKREKNGRSAADEVDEMVLPVEAVSEQSLTFLNLSVLVFLFIMLSTLLFENLVPLQWMNDVTIWEVVTVTDAGNIIEQISLKEVLSALIILGVSLFSAKNLPGLLELLLLHRLNISTGAAYATTTLLRYLLVLCGVLIGISMLGFHWSKLQWLVAALSVGLGFGLQEIFANLVSGIILLFERPIRVGDTITIQDLSGVVTRINTRATTILDWDKKEIVVPNKSLITEQLVNWSLSDATTRIIIPVGVAYGSDVELVRKLLLQAASECDEITQEPAPQALFLTFGASSLDFELRVFLPQVDLRSITQDKLNTRIDQLFRQHQIEIPFPQMDVHVRKLPAE